MEEINNGIGTDGWVQCAARCILLCGACGITPIPGDEVYGAVAGSTTGAAGF
ncbi:hypothetical protein [Tissierella creatinophila]|uniref:Uncharacterized protein n=1 Tax=Tissierella creatinophila DSM 6911 TaxID=1123403 RepID=A0A1U7M4S7_TISCR|nr:hypothetical protein [Tissierella creatinophila]OLS02198.1 hypothetical protein TICRE_18380 [Tissierella creatinophila DSM 6911]